jgi:hypothetical protein
MLDEMSEFEWDNELDRINEMHYKAHLKTRAMKILSQVLGVPTEQLPKVTEKELESIDDSVIEATHKIARRIMNNANN